VDAAPDQIVLEMISRLGTHPAHYLRDRFGTVFRHTPADPAWLTPAVLALARTV
jgi:hypothetical protein